MNSRKPLRLWPAVAIAMAQLLVMFLGPVVAPDAPLPVGLIGAVAGGALILLWWLLFSRARWIERLGAIVMMITGVLATSLFVHPSIAGAGQGMLLYVLSVPYLALALVAWAVASRNFAERKRFAALAAAIAIVCVAFASIRTDGVSDTVAQYHWRWTPTSEDRLLAAVNDEPVPLASTAVVADAVEAPAAPAPAEMAGGGRVADDARDTGSVATPAATAPGAAAAPGSGPAKAEGGPAKAEGGAEWPGFRGPNRDGVVHGLRIRTDWSSSPPVELWRRPIGPGWSSFSVRGDLLYTQEQRGEQELVGCYRVSTGEPVWRHRDQVRFYESNGGPGPRGTPTISGARVFAFGATGILNALDARTGKLIWSRNVATDTGRRVPDWGFASSPLVLEDLVIVAAAGTLAGYDAATGNPRWRGPSYGGSYSSPHLATLDGVTQVVLLGGPGVISVDPATGAVLWKHEWSPGPIVQPAVIADGDLLVNAITATGGTGTRRLAVSRPGESWTVEERWTSNGLKPFFNDFVVHKGHAFGFDGAILASINLEDGKRDWKGGRYGNGQMVLLAEQDLLLILSEEGEIALVAATTEQYKEIARIPALNGKTWNHPVLVGDVLLIRNGEEMAAFRLPVEAANTLSH